MDADANANANADAGGSTIALRELCSGELMSVRPAKTQIRLGGPESSLSHGESLSP